jgi:prepilin-type processing-associated H-X9-DG protein
VLPMRRFGLTLIELLSTIGIIVVLIAILIPFIHRAKLQAKATVCTSNIRQLSEALFSYAADNGRFPYGFYSYLGMQPPEGGYAGYQQYDRKGWWWFNYLEGLYVRSMGKRTVLQCPSKYLPQPLLEDDILCGNYGVNISLCKISQEKSGLEEFIGEPQAGIEIKHSSQTLLLLDSGYTIINWWQAADIPPMPLGNSQIEDTAYVPGLKINKNRLLWSGGAQNFDSIYGRHPRRTVNVGFLDGRVERCPADDLLVEKTPDGYKNRVPLWSQK